MKIIERTYVEYIDMEELPLTGLRLLRWKLAIHIYRIGCWLSGRHDKLLVWEPSWKDWYCPHCGYVAETKAAPE